MSKNRGFRVAALAAAVILGAGMHSVYATQLTITANQVWSESIQVDRCQVGDLSFEQQTDRVIISGINSQCAGGAHLLYVTALDGQNPPQPVATLSGHEIVSSDVDPGYVWQSPAAAGAASFVYSIV